MVYRLSAWPDCSASFSKDDAKMDKCVVRCSARVRHGEVRTQRFHFVSGEQLLLGAAPALPFVRAQELFRDAMPGHGSLLPPQRYDSKATVPQSTLGSANIRPGVLARCDGAVFTGCPGWAPGRSACSGPNTPPAAEPSTSTPPSSPGSPASLSSAPPPRIPGSAPAFPPGSVVAITIDRCSYTVTVTVESAPGVRSNRPRPFEIATLDPRIVTPSVDVCFVAAGGIGAERPPAARLLRPAEIPATVAKLVNNVAAERLNYFGPRALKAMAVLDALGADALK